jgi:glycerophosphoryl diester phosphodiesterase
MIMRWKPMLLAVVLMFSLAVVPALDGNASVAHAEDNFLNIAHRGASGHAPENTMAAFDKAVEMKADYFELDVQMTKDGHLVVIHDTTVDRTTNGTGNVKDYTLKEIRQLDAGSWFGPEYQGERIPTLDEVLDKYQGKIGILIELKKPSLYPGIEKKVAQELKERNLHKPHKNIIVQSFDQNSLKTFHRLLPQVPIGVLVSLSENPNGISKQQLLEFATYADYVNPHHKLVDKDLVDNIHLLGMKITPYTILDKQTTEAMVYNGVDGIITNYPELGFIK